MDAATRLAGGAMNEYPRLCVVTAVDLEFDAAAGLLDGKTISSDSLVCAGRRGDRQITVLKAGMSALGFAARFSAHLAPGLPRLYDAVIVAGLAGGLNSKLGVGDAAVYDRCLDVRSMKKDGRKIEPPRDEIASLVSDNPLSTFLESALRAASIPAHRGAAITMGQIVTEGREKRALGLRYGADAVDMETFAVWEVAARTGAPVAALRIISDDAMGDIPDFNRAYTPEGRMIASQMARVMAARPGVTARFLNNLRIAAGAFKRGLEAVFDA
jgi:nucleoside phosphorylase